MQFAMMSDKLRAHVPFHDTDRILRAFKKYTMLYAGDGSFTEFFIKRGAFPVTMTDPRGDRRIARVYIYSGKEVSGKLVKAIDCIDCVPSQTPKAASAERTARATVPAAL
jgi:hypothetical protein